MNYESEILTKAGTEEELVSGSGERAKVRGEALEEMRERPGGQTPVWGSPEGRGTGNRAVNCLNVDLPVFGSP